MDRSTPATVSVTTPATGSCGQAWHTFHICYFQEESLWRMVLRGDICTHHFPHLSPQICPHGVLQGSKFLVLAESTRDSADLKLSKKFNSPINILGKISFYTIIINIYFPQTLPVPPQPTSFSARKKGPRQ